MTHSYMWLDSWHDSLPLYHVTWRIHIYERVMAYTSVMSHMWHDSFTCVTWLTPTFPCDMTHSYIWTSHVIYICHVTCATWLIHMCDTTWLIHMCAMTHSHGTTTMDGTNIINVNHHAPKQPHHSPKEPSYIASEPHHISKEPYDIQITSAVYSAFIINVSLVYSVRSDSVKTQ